MGKVNINRFILMHMGCLCCGTDPHLIKGFDDAEAAYAHRVSLEMREEVEPECAHYRVFDLFDVEEAE